MNFVASERAMYDIVFVAVGQFAVATNDVGHLGHIAHLARWHQDANALGGA